MSAENATAPVTATSWRTVVTALVVGGFQTAAFVYGTRHGWSEQGASAFGSLCLWSTVAAAGQAARSSIESLAVGGGLKGALAALTTATKPGDPPPAPPAA
jgi:hypothetical protein